MTTEKADAHGALRVLWCRAWPLAGLMLAMLINASWLGLLGYGLVRLL